MDNEQFVAKLNRILTERHLKLPQLDRTTSPSAEVVAVWAAFLRECVKSGIHISDPRWRQLSLVRRGPVTQFVLDAPEAGEPDDDFKVGLKLLMGMLGGADR
jgi:hypothetical protein